MQSLAPWLMLLVGLVLGWLIAWLLGRSGSKKLEARGAQAETDLRTRTDELSACRNRTATLQSDYEGRLTSLQADLQSRTTDLERANSSLAQLQSDTASRINTLQADLQARDAELTSANVRLAELESSAATRSAGVDVGALPAQTSFSGPVQVEGDDFTKIRGVGPAFAAGLTSAGIHRYADLAAADPQELNKALEIREWQKVDTAAWVADAKILAGRPRQVQIGDDLTRLEGIGPAYATRLRAAGITTYAQLAVTDEGTLAEIIGAPAWRRPNYDEWIAQARLAAASDETGSRCCRTNSSAAKATIST